ncbi:MAG: dipicolinate synthase subunit DpsA [Clostridia bacterium]|nr:dipicolinate synthase subunit DpsA [Clostridia bacterium]
MNRLLTGRRIGIIGGDKRELVLMEELHRLGADVMVTGYEQLTQLPGGLAHWDLRENLTRAEGVILPMPGTDEQGKVKADFANRPLVLQPEDFALLSPGTPLLVGIAGRYLKDQSSHQGLKLIETAELDEIAVYNSIPTAEGAIAIAIQETSITLHGAQMLIVGFGRIGMTLARMLKGIGAHVAVVARKTVDLARAEEQGYLAFDYQTVFPVLSQIDVVFNTVPYPVIREEYLKRLKSDTILIELASSPGGFDLAGAERLGLKVIKAMGLPGKTAPLTAGKILSRVYPKLLLQHWEQGESKEGS